MKESWSLRRGVLALALASLSGSALAATACPSAHPEQKTHKLYLLFAQTPLKYPSFGFSAASATDPAQPFSAADLSGFTGSTAALRAAIVGKVASDYCDFNVQVLDTSTLPPSTYANRNTVAVTTATDVGEGLFGFSESLDTGDRTAVDYSYVWAKTYAEWAGTALSGANSTLARWARAIGGSATHEAAHNYGLAHSDSNDPSNLMTAGREVDAETRAGVDRSFGDAEFSILAANVGLSMQTMWNWELINPNAAPAHSLELRVLHPSSTAPALDDAYAGCDSPWIAPTVSGPIGPAETVQGATYYPYRVLWNTPNPAWGSGRCTGSKGPPGQAPGGARFYVGAAFMATRFNLSMPEPVLLQSVSLRDGSGKALGLNPHVHSFDAGTFDKDGNWNLSVSNAAAMPLSLENLRIRQLPRMLDQQQMRRGGGMLDRHGRDVPVWQGSDWGLGGGYVLPAEPMTVPSGKVSQERHSHDVVDADDCGDSFLAIPDTLHCRRGTVVDLFPSTTVYFTADSVESNATYWDSSQSRYVRGDVTTRTFYQLTGRRLDLDGNGIDDYIDAHPAQ